ncbi:MAG: CopG family antitoxin [Patescibacteria group bacterium]|nr:CopG family antitoxin [Patescibacteria group bacterium]
MNNKKFNKEEKIILEDFESGQFKKVKNVQKEKECYQEHAKKTLSKSKSINIRISERDLQKIKSLAVEKGMPYQTLISSLLKRYTNKRRKERVS